MPHWVKWILENLAPSAVFSIAFALVSNYGVYWFVFHSALGRRLFAGRRHYTYEHTRSDLWREARNMIVPETILAFIVGLIARSASQMPLSPYLSIRWDLSWAGVPRILVECLAIFWIYEIYYFFLHRMIHHRALFRAFHNVHHQSIYPTPFTQTSVNFLEAVSFYSFYVGMLFAPVHIVSLVVIGLNIKLASLTQHLGHECFPRFMRRTPVLKYLNSTRYHQLHHSHSFKHNFGFQTSLLDRLFGTIDPEYLDYERES